MVVLTQWEFCIVVKDELLTHVHTYRFLYVADEFLLLESVNRF